MIKQKTEHTPVMLAEVLEHLNLSPGACIVDCTLGLGGHSMKIVKEMSPKGCLIAIDRDESSIRIAREMMKEFSGICSFVHQDFRNIDDILNDLGIKEVDGFLFDLGISSYQLESTQRGFSLQSDGPLDMRMDQNTYISAYDLINSLSEKELASILKMFGEERFSRRIAHNLVKKRSEHPIESTHDLTDTVISSLPRSYKRTKIHPATRTFQAFRIAVNRELEALDIALDKCVSFLKKGGRLCVISFHSLEDRIVKQKFRYFQKEGAMKILTKKPLRPGDQETEFNRRSRSARLRVAEKI